MVATSRTRSHDKLNPRGAGIVRRELSHRDILRRQGQIRSAWSEHERQLRARRAVRQLEHLWVLLEHPESE